MQRERSPRGQRRVLRARRRPFWLAGLVGLLLVVGLWAAFGGAGGPPPNRPLGAGLPPAPVPGLASWTDGPDGAAAARRAEIAAEEARLAALRAARQRLEQEVAALERDVEARAQRGAGPDTVAGAAPARAIPTGPSLAGGGGPPASDAVPRSLRIFVHHRANSAEAASAASAVAQSLRGGGFEVQAVRGATFVPSTPVVRYFHEEDQAAAARLAGRLGQGWAIQDFRAFLPQPAPQTLEVWLPAN